MKAKRILIVDDEKECCELLKDYFISNDYAVDIICDGKEAQHLLESHTYEYIIFDYKMPGFSGADLAKAIKEKSPQSKKILISGYLNDDEVMKDLEVDAFLHKPFVIDDLVAIIKNW